MIARAEEEDERRREERVWGVMRRRVGRDCIILCVEQKIDTV